MAHGGVRPGAGRPKGSKDKQGAESKKAAIAAARVLKAKGYEIAAKVIEGMTPLEVLTETMLRLRDAAIECEQKQIIAVDADQDAKDDKGNVKVYTAVELRLLACEQAAKAAPYVHAKLQAIEANVNHKLSLYEAGLLELAADDAGS